MTPLSAGVPSGDVDGEFSALAECNFVIDETAQKADRYKSKARWSAPMLTISTALVPVTLIAAEQFDPSGVPAFLFGRLVPALLAAFAAVLGRWILLEQPHQRWTLYRAWQRKFECERLRYRQGIGAYSGENRDDELAEMVATGRVLLDEEWSHLVPRSKELVDKQGAGQ